MNCFGVERLEMAIEVHGIDELKLFMINELNLRASPRNGLKN
jgi:hypothetical protein